MRRDTWRSIGILNLLGGDPFGGAVIHPSPPTVPDEIRFATDHRKGNISLALGYDYIAHALGVEVDKVGYKKRQHVVYNILSYEILGLL